MSQIRCEYCDRVFERGDLTVCPGCGAPLPPPEKSETEKLAEQVFGLVGKTFEQAFRTQRIAGTVVTIIFAVIFLLAVVFILAMTARI